MCRPNKRNRSMRPIYTTNFCLEEIKKLACNSEGINAACGFAVGALRAECETSFKVPVQKITQPHVGCKSGLKYGGVTYTCK